MNCNALVIHAECPVVRDNWLEILFRGCGHMIQAGGKTTTKTTLAKRFVLETILRNWWWRCSVAAPYTIFEKSLQVISVTPLSCYMYMYSTSGKLSLKLIFFNHLV